MSTTNTLNVFKGADAMAQYFNPDLQPPLPLVEIPARLNPFRGDGVRIYAKMMTALPAQNVKALPALNMLLNQPSAANKSIVEASSGSTVISLGIVSRVLWGNEDVCAYVTNKKHPDQLRILRFFGLKVSLYGGLAQQEPVDPKGIMNRLRKLSKKDPDTFIYPGQYDNADNWQSHTRWTGPQIWNQLPEINVLCTTVGTGGCITGTGSYLKSQKQSLRVVGVCNAFNDPTPGPRHFPGFESCRFPWRDTIDTFETVSSAESYRMSMKLSREGIICGPSSGEALHGLLNYLQKLKDAGNLQEIADPITREISCVFICCDLPYQYMEGYFQKLELDEFPPIYNDILLNCDLDKYSEAWECSPSQAVKLLCSGIRSRRHGLPCNDPTCYGKSCSKKNKFNSPVILDLRDHADFSAKHIRGSLNSPLKGISPQPQDIFGHAEILHELWKNLRQKFDEDPKMLGSKSRPLIVLCYDGEVSRLATSVLRGRDYKAINIANGFPAFYRFASSRK